MSPSTNRRPENLASSYPDEFSQGKETGISMANALFSLAATNGTIPPTETQAKGSAVKSAEGELLYHEGKAVEPPPTEGQLKAARFGAKMGVHEAFVEGVTV